MFHAHRRTCKGVLFALRQRRWLWKKLALCLMLRPSSSLALIEFETNLVCLLPPLPLLPLLLPQPQLQVQLHYITLQKLHCSTLQLQPEIQLHYITQQYNYTTTTLHHTTLHYSNFITLHCKCTYSYNYNYHYITLHYTALIALHYTTTTTTPIFLHYITLGYTTLYHTTVHNITVRYSRLR